MVFPKFGRVEVSGFVIYYLHQHVVATPPKVCGSAPRRQVPDNQTIAFQGHEDFYSNDVETCFEIVPDLGGTGAAQRK